MKDLLNPTHFKFTIPKAHAERRDLAASGDTFRSSIRNLLPSRTNLPAMLSLFRRKLGDYGFASRAVRPNTVEPCRNQVMFIFKPKFGSVLRQKTLQSLSHFRL